LGPAKIVPASLKAARDAKVGARTTVFLRALSLSCSLRKKSGKTTLAALVMITIILLYGGRFAEGYCVANDLEQAVSRVFTMVCRIVEASPLLRAIARITSESRLLSPARREHCRNRIRRRFCRWRQPDD
jgi:phage terminase large subunit-like protein